MRLPDLELAFPDSIAGASRYLEAGSDDAQVIAGGTDLLIALKEGQKHPRTLVDLSAIPGLDTLEYSPEDGLELGPLVTLRQLTRDPVIREHYPVLARTAAQVGTVQLQAAATIGGNLCQDSCCMYFNRPEQVRRPLPPCHKLGGSICHVVPTSDECWAPYSGDMAPVLIALDASVGVVDRDGERIFPLADIYSDNGAAPLNLEPGQFITRVCCPAPAPRTGTVYIKLRPRATLDYAIAGVAASVTLGASGTVCSGATVVLTGVASGPKAVGETEDLIGNALTEEAIEKVAAAATKLSFPVKNVVGSEPGYRRKMVKFNVARAIREAAEEAGK